MNKLKFNIVNRATPNDEQQKSVIYYKLSSKYINELEFNFINNSVKPLELNSPIIISINDEQSIKDLSINLTDILIEEKLDCFSMLIDRANMKLVIGKNIKQQNNSYKCDPICLQPQEQQNFVLKNVITTNKETNEGYLNIASYQQEFSNQDLDIKLLKAPDDIKDDLLKDVLFEFTKMPLEVEDNLKNLFTPGSAAESWVIGKDKVVINTLIDTKVNGDYGKYIKSLLCLSITNRKSNEPLISTDGDKAQFKIYFDSNEQARTNNLNNSKKIKEIKIAYSPIENDSIASSYQWMCKEPAINDSYWLLTTNNPNILGSGINSAATEYFIIYNIEANSKDGNTSMYIEWKNIRNYKDGITTITIKKVRPTPIIFKFEEEDKLKNHQYNLDKLEEGKESIRINYNIFGTNSDWCLTVSDDNKRKTVLLKNQAKAQYDVTEIIKKQCEAEIKLNSSKDIALTLQSIPAITNAGYEKSNAFSLIIVTINNK